MVLTQSASFNVSHSINVGDYCQEPVGMMLQYIINATHEKQQSNKHKRYQKWC